MSGKRKIILIAITGLVFFGSAMVWTVGGILCAPRHRQIGPPPQDLPAENFQIESSSGSKVSGWLIRADEARGVVVLMHGVRNCRLGMLERARFLHENGYAVILFDFQAHGESSGDHITFGHLESRDALAVVAFAHQEFPAGKVAVIGGSMGGAAAVLADPPLSVDAMILEMVYPTFHQAVSARLKMKLGAIGSFFSPLLIWQLKPRLGFGPDDLRPIDKVREIAAPKLFIAGDADQHTPLSEARELFNAAPEPKQFWEVKGGEHADLHAHARPEYEKRILNFLEHSFLSLPAK